MYGKSLKTTAYAMPASYVKNSPIFAVMLGSSFMGWVAAPIALVYIMVCRSMPSCLAAVAVFVALGDIKACALAAVPLCVVDPMVAVVLAPAAAIQSALVARIVVAVAACVKIWWLGTAAPAHAGALTRML